MGQDFYPYCPAPCKVNFDKGNEFGEPSKIVEMPASWYMDDFPSFRVHHDENRNEASEPDI